MTIRPCAPSDEAAIAAYLGHIPEAERAFYKDGGTDADLAAAWAADADPLRLVDVDDDGSIRGMIGVRRGRGQSVHTGEITLMVDPAYRRQGVAAGLVQAALGAAIAEGLTHIFVEVTADHAATLGMFAKFGFEAEALLRGFIKSTDGELRDLVMMTNRIEENWAAAQLIGIDSGDLL